MVKFGRFLKIWATFYPKFNHTEWATEQKDLITFVCNDELLVRGDLEGLATTSKTCIPAAGSSTSSRLTEVDSYKVGAFYKI